MASVMRFSWTRFDDDLCGHKGRYLPFCQTMLSMGYPDAGQATSTV